MEFNRFQIHAMQTKAAGDFDRKIDRRQDLPPHCFYRESDPRARAQADAAWRDLESGTLTMQKAGTGIIGCALSLAALAVRP
ncbi:hypothetical protein [Cupriavidus necator]|uniref:hypothetical protein n=1 Tax=Cupriavidus necator TaxID=106590 RepID=UPI0012D2B711|nr:hypothetical protein [Cupriavidus necator]